MSIKKKATAKKEEAKEVKKTPFVQKDFTGALFINDRKEEETHPDYKGSVVIEGVEYWVSAWEKVSQAGKDYISLAFKAKEVE